MVASQVINLCTVHGHFQYATHHLHVFFREITFLEIPHVEDVAVQHKGARLDALQVVAQFVGVATISAQMHVRNYNDVEFSFHVKKIADDEGQL